jgi:tRNA(adenine34) deaminase
MISEHPIIPRDKTFMQMALDLAQEAYRAEEVPVGAIMVKDAELLAIRAAAEALGSWRLTDTTLYVTLEPCAMCAGAIIQSRISRLVFGTWDPKAGACGSICDLTAETRFNHRVIVHSGMMAEDCRHLLQNFFQQLREAQPVSS